MSLEPMKLGMVAIAPGLAPQHSASQECFAPQGHQTLRIEVLGMKSPESHADSAAPGVVVNAVPGRKGGCVSSSGAAGDEALGDVAAGEVEMAEGAAEFAGGIEARDRFAVEADDGVRLAKLH